MSNLVAVAYPDEATAALFVLVRSSTPDKVLPRIAEYGGELLHTSLSTEAEETLREALVEGVAAR
jgi:uncharacterized membrane protein